MNKPFSSNELDEALSTLKLKKSPGPDQITNEMLLHLGPQAKKKLLQLYNESWKTGVVPQTWRDAVMIPVHKRGKDRTKPESYRPISLISCPGKLMERLINTRLMWHLEEKQHLTPQQAAFRQDRSTEDQVSYISQSIEDAFQDKQHTLAVWVDMEKAFDKVWKDGLKLKMRQCGVGGRMYRWISQYLYNRRARVQVNSKRSKKKILRQGVPQGGVLSPTLFLIFIKDILDQMPKKVRGAVYADDLVLWCSEEHFTTANYRLQQALIVLETWTKSWLVKVNEQKTTYSIFSLSNQDPRINLQINGHTLQLDDSPSYLGVTFDRRLTWKSQTAKTQARAKQRLGLMKKLSGTQWGADQAVLKKLYIGRVRPVLEYGMAPTATAAKSNTDRLVRVQNQAMRIMTGAMRTTPIRELETATGLHSLEDRRNIKVLTQAAKFKRLPGHPMYSRMNDPTKGRLKRSSFLQQSRILERRDPELLDHSPAPIPPVTTLPAWERDHFPTIRDSVPGVGSKDSQSDQERRVLTLELIHSAYPEKLWTHIYTDGSATEATKNGGGGVLIKYKDGASTLAVPTGAYSTNYKAEAEALRTAAQDATNNLHRIDQKVVIFTDALSVLQALKKPYKDLNQLSCALSSLSVHKEVVLQWIPAHCGVAGNETADRLAKEGGLLEQHNTSVSYSDEKTIIRNLINKRWHEEHPNYSKSDSYHKLCRADQVILIRLRTGHNRMRAHLYNKLKIGQTEKCPCDTAPMTTAHLLQDCPMQDALRQATWPDDTPLAMKLYGSLADLKRTAAFVREAGVTI